MSWACGVHIDQCHSIKLCREASEDISIKMKRRAENGYGLEVNDRWGGGGGGEGGVDVLIICCG